METVEVVADRPCVSVLTPVYNGEQYLAECIESVLAQDDATFEYDIVDNCSTDGSREIAESYARQDPRIRVRTNSVFVSAIENHNRALALIPPHAKYCKIVSADDWISPKCLSKLVGFGEAHPTVGIVGCYQRSGDKVKWQGVPPSVSVMSGRDACRMPLLEGTHFFGTPTSVLYRADMIRKRTPFFPHNRSHADTSAVYETLRSCDFGFVHEVLSNERVHSGQWSAEMDALDAGSVGYLEVLLQYGPVYLTATELAARKKQVFDAYYRALGGNVWKLKSREFWKFQRSRLNEIGCELEWSKVAKASVIEAVSEARNPLTAMRKVLAVLKGQPV